MKRDIEQQLKDKREMLDLEEPPKALWHNIRSEWQKPVTKSTYATWWKVAAILFLVSSVTLLVQNAILKQEVDELASLGDISHVYRKIERNYQLEINQLTRSISLYEIGSKEEYKWVLEELQSLEEINKQYREDIGKPVDQERLINALLDYYEKKIRLLRKLQLEINRQQHEKDNTITTSTI